MAMQKVRKPIKLEDIAELGGDESDIELIKDVSDDEDVEEFEAPDDDLDAEVIKKEEIRDFIKQLGFSELKKKTKSEELGDAKIDVKKVKLKEKPLSEQEKKDKKSADIQSLSKIKSKEVTYSLASFDFASTHKPRKHLLLKPGKWSDNDSLAEPTTFDQQTKDVVEKVEKFAKQLLEEELNLYKTQQNSRKKSSDGWLNTVLAKGTSADRMAALIVLVQEAPIHNVHYLDTLIATLKKDHRKSLVVLDLLKDLFLTELLLENRKLKTFDQHPLTMLNQLASGNKDSRDRHILICFYEAQLKQKYEEFVKAVETLSHDKVETMRKKATAVMFQLLSENAEQEKFKEMTNHMTVQQRLVSPIVDMTDHITFLEAKLLLSMLVNKLGDPTFKIAANAAHLLSKLVAKHPRMKMVVTVEVERLLYRSNISPKAQYYAVCFLSQLILSKNENELASRLLVVYFSFFKVYVKKGEIDSKMLGALLTGVNRAYPFAKVDKEKILEQTETLYKIIHVAKFNTSIQALMLLYQVMDISDNASDRFYMALYRKLTDLELQSSTKLTLFLNLLCKGLKKDVVDRRVQAFIKRLLQVCQFLSPPFICSSLMLLSEILKTRRHLLKLSKTTEDSDDEEEHFVDAKDDEDAAEEMESKDDDAASDESSSGNIAGDDVKAGQSSWVHRKNLSFKLGDYDPTHRNPLYCRADLDCTWELRRLTSHYHPSVVVFANSLLKGENISYSGDPLEDFSFRRFLDRFICRNPKKTKPDEVSKGFQARKKPLSLSVVRNIPANSFDYLEKAKDIPAEEQYLYKFYSCQENKAIKKKKNDDDDASSVESVSDDEFESYLNKFEKGVEGGDLDVDLGSELKKNKKDKSKKESKDTGSSSESDAEFDEDDLSDEEIDFGSDFDEEFAEDKEAGFDEEAVAFSDEDALDAFQPETKKRKREKETSAFADAEEFSDLIDDAKQMKNMKMEDMRENRHQRYRSKNKKSRFSNKPKRTMKKRSSR